jgi:hypothetical protein
MDTSGNPYLSPQTNPVMLAGRNLFPDIATPDLKKLRNDSHSIRTFMVLLLLGVVIFLLAGIGFLAGGKSGATAMGEFAFFVVAGGLNLITAIGLMTRAVWGRYLGFVCAAFALLGFPVGTLIGILMLVALGRGARLFGPDRLDHKALNTEWKYRKANKVP